MNHRDAVTAAVLDIVGKKQSVFTDKKAYTFVQRISQSITLEYSGSSEVLNTTEVETILIANDGSDTIRNTSKLTLESGRLVFSLRGARSKGQLLGKRK
jgi:hypothetical protein